MAKRHDKTETPRLEPFPPLPLSDGHWVAIVRSLQLSPRQAKIVELTLRGACNKQIAAAMHITEPTLKTYQQRISVRTRTRGRMELAMRVLAVSHEVGRHQG
jgi:DNA-binding NarL/FixJ family response regulator